MSNLKVERADIELSCRVRIRLHADGTSEIRRLHFHQMPPILSRPHTKEELEIEGNGDEWWEGGTAILDPSAAPNGLQMVSDAHTIADDLQAAISRAVQPLDDDD